MMKRILYIGNDYYLKIKPYNSLINFLKERYKLSFVFLNSELNAPRGLNECRGIQFDLLLLNQIFPSEDFLAKNFIFKNKAFISSCDNNLEEDKIYLLQDYKIICFSKKECVRLKNQGLDVMYMQFFSKSVGLSDLGKDDSVFFLQPDEQQKVLNWIESSKKALPLVTVVTACKNLYTSGRARFFEQCLASVRYQTYSNIEHIVIDGQSTDNTLYLLEKYKCLGWITYISEPDNGMYEALNKGIKHANGKYIIFLNTDDFFHDIKAVEKSIVALENSEADFSCASNRMMDTEGTVYAIRKPDIGSFVAQMPFSHQTMFTKVDLLKKYGMFNEKYKSAADYDLVIRLLLGGVRYVEVKDDIVTYRRGGMSETLMQRSLNETEEIYKTLYGSFYKASEWKDTAKEITLRKVPKDFLDCMVKNIPLSLSNEIHKSIISENDVEYIFPTPQYIVLDCEANEKELYFTTQKARLAKLHDYFELFNQWMQLKQKRIRVSSYFEIHKMHHIAIYGMGKVGDRLLEELLSGTTVVVDYAIDRKIKHHPLLKIYNPDDFLPSVNAIVITINSFFPEIEKKLTNKVSCPILSINDIIRSLVF